MPLTLVANSGGFAGKAEKQTYDSLIANAGILYYSFQQACLLEMLRKNSESLIANAGILYYSFQQACFLEMLWKNSG